MDPAIGILIENQKNGPKLGTKMVPGNGTIFGFGGPDFAAHLARIPCPGGLALAIHCGAVFLSIAKHLLCRFHNFFNHLIVSPCADLRDLFRGH